MNLLQPGQKFNTIIQKTGQIKPDTINILQGIGLDSLKEKMVQKADSLNSIIVFDKAHANLDTLDERIHSPANFVNQKITVVQEKIEEKAKQSEDSLRHRVDEIESGIQKTRIAVQNKLDSAQTNVGSTLLFTKDKAEDKITEIVDKNNDLPGVEKIGLPKVMTEGSIPEINTSIPGLDPEIKPELSKIETPSLQIPDLKEKLPDIKTPEVNQLKKVNDISEEAGKVTDKISELENSRDELKEIKENTPEKLEKLPEEAEKRVEDVAEVKVLKGEIAKTTEERIKYEAMLQKYRDQKLLQAEFKRKATGIVNDQLGEHSKKIEAAQKKLAQSKKSFSNIKSIKDVFKRRSDELLKKKFYQRLVPGITWQIYNKDMVAIDFGLQAGYRISPRFTAGAGFVYRAGLSDKFDSYIKGLKTYGGRVYGELAIVKGLFAHGEFEFLSVDPFLNAQSPEPTNRNVTGSYFGLGKRFKISRNFRGNIQGLYRVEYNGELPSVNKVTARFGVEYIFRKAKKKLVIPKLK